MKKQSRVALVTGGAVRIGRAICEALAGDGFDVVIHCNRSVKEACTLAARIRRRGVRAWVVEQVLDDERSCVQLIRRALDEAGRLDVLVNNAAIFHKGGLAGLTGTELMEEFKVNCFAPVLLMREFARRARRGCVVNLLDRRIAANDPECPSYSVSKKALAAFTEEMALILAPGFRVNAVAPGPILPPPGKGVAYFRDRAGRIPLARKITPGEVAAAVVTLIRMEAVTGQVLFVDGGQHLLGGMVEGRMVDG